MSVHAVCVTVFLRHKIPHNRTCVFCPGFMDGVMYWVPWKRGTQALSCFFLGSGWDCLAQICHGGKGVVRVPEMRPKKDSSEAQARPSPSPACDVKLRLPSSGNVEKGTGAFCGSPQRSSLY